MKALIPALLMLLVIAPENAHAQQAGEFKPFTCKVRKEMKGDVIVFNSIRVDKPLSTTITLNNDQKITFDDWTLGSLDTYERAGKRDDGTIYVWNAKFYPSQSVGWLKQVHIEGKQITINNDFRLTCSYDLF